MGFVQTGGSKNLFEYYDSIDDFPQTGRKNILYFSKQSKNTYTWNEEEQKYILISQKSEMLSEEGFYQKYISEMKQYLDL